jgi:hypothetical protein
MARARQRSIMPTLLCVLLACVIVPPVGTALTAQIAGRQEWTLESSGVFDNFGVVTAIARCGDTLYLADSRLRIRRYDLVGRRLLTDLPVDRVPLVTAMHLDCNRRVLFVVTPAPIGKSTGAVTAFHLDTGEQRREYALPQGFLPRPGGRLLPSESLVLSGLWVPPDRSPASLLERHSEEYYEELRLGLTLLLTTGETEPLLVPYENQCIGGGQCPDVRTDTVVTAQGLRHIAALPTSTHVGIYESGTAFRRVDIRSPQFVRDGQVLPVRVPVDVRMRWLGQNSVIDHVLAFADVFAIVHHKARVGPNWKMGDPSRGSSFMNLYDWDGRQRAVDVPIPSGFNLGHDNRYAYAVDYGPDGPRDGVSWLKLIQIPVGR